MTPAARVQAAIEILDRVLAGVSAEQALTGWARGSRFAGSGDRAAVRDHVFDALRRMRSLAALSGASHPSGRALMIGALRDRLTEVFSGLGHGPAPLTADEMSALSAVSVNLPQLVRLDCPDWLAPALQSALGPDFAPVMEAQRHRAPVFLRVNLARGDRDAARMVLAGNGVETRPCGLVETALEVTAGANRIKRSQAFLDGLVELQDLSSQAAVAALPLKGGMRVLDYCAGGGGKILAIAARIGGHFTAHDAAFDRMGDLPARASRAGVKVHLARSGDLTAQSYDLVLVDAPCSGSGTWRRTPDAKWRLTQDRLDELCALQAGILDQALRFVRPGGVLAYMTCSLISSENEDQVAALLDRHPALRITATRRFSPLTGGDGFFLAQMLCP
jgi:16S rRNA (cytosine967-C5)-methyltransferase